jgi:hypothetical protein
MRTHFVVVDEPCVCCVAKVRERSEDLDIKELVADPSVKRLDPRVLSGFARIDKVQQYFVIG